MNGANSLDKEAAVRDFSRELGYMRQDASWLDQPTGVEICNDVAVALHAIRRDPSDLNIAAVLNIIRAFDKLSENTLKASKVRLLKARAKGLIVDIQAWADELAEAEYATGSQEKAPPELLSADDFINSYRPQRPLLKSWDMKSGWLYSFTAPTGGAKTAIALCEAIDLALDGKRVVYLAGENSDDVRERVLLVQAELMLANLPPTLHFMDRTFSLYEGLDHVRGQVEDIGGADLVIVDTSPAFQIASGGAEENSNNEQIRWAILLRELTRLEGLPAVLALCHPTKWPQNMQDCLPRGGGGFIAEVDGNYVSWPTVDNDFEKFFELRWVGKFRGGFAPLTYRVQKATCERLDDPDGNPCYSVWAHRADEQHVSDVTASQGADNAKLLMAMVVWPGKSFAEWAELLGWQMPSGPAKYRVERAMKRLLKDKLVRTDGGGHYDLTPAGRRQANHSVDHVGKPA